MSEAIEKPIIVKMRYVSGEFNLNHDKIVCVADKKHTTVSLCFQCNMNIPFAEIKLYDSNLLVDAERTFKDAAALGGEIENRFNKKVLTAPKPEPSKNKTLWKLCRCVYNEDGLLVIEDEHKEEFADALKLGCDISWLLATIIPTKNNRVIARVELEGSKENLELVLAALETPEPSEFTKTIQRKLLDVSLYCGGVKKTHKIFQDLLLEACDLIDTLSAELAEVKKENQQLRDYHCVVKENHDENTLGCEALAAQQAEIKRLKIDNEDLQKKLALKFCAIKAVHDETYEQRIAELEAELEKALPIIIKYQNVCLGFATESHHKGRIDNREFWTQQAKTIADLQSEIEKLKGDKNG